MDIILLNRIVHLAQICPFIFKILPLNQRLIQIKFQFVHKVQSSADIKIKTQMQRQLDEINCSTSEMPGSYSSAQIRHISRIRAARSCHRTKPQRPSAGAAAHGPRATIQGKSPQGHSRPGPLRTELRTQQRRSCAGIGQSLPLADHFQRLGPKSASRSKVQERGNYRVVEVNDQMQIDNIYGQYDKASEPLGPAPALGDSQKKFHETLLIRPQLDKLNVPQYLGEEAYDHFNGLRRSHHCRIHRDRLTPVEVRDNQDLSVLHSYQESHSSTQVRAHFDHQAISAQEEEIEEQQREAPQELDFQRGSRHVSYLDHLFNEVRHASQEERRKKTSSMDEELDEFIELEKQSRKSSHCQSLDGTVVQSPSRLQRCIRQINRYEQRQASTSNDPVQQKFNFEGMDMEASHNAGPDHAKSVSKTEVSSPQYLDDPRFIQKGCSDLRATSQQTEFNVKLEEVRQSLEEAGQTDEKEAEAKPRRNRLPPSTVSDANKGGQRKLPSNSNKSQIGALFGRKSAVLDQILSAGSFKQRKRDRASAGKRVQTLQGSHRSKGQPPNEQEVGPNEYEMDQIRQFEPFCAERSDQNEQESIVTDAAATRVVQTIEQTVVYRDSPQIDQNQADKTDTLRGETSEEAAENGSPVPNSAAQFLQQPMIIQNTTDHALFENNQQFHQKQNLNLYINQHSHFLNNNQDQQQSTENNFEVQEEKTFEPKIITQDYADFSIKLTAQLDSLDLSNKPKRLGQCQRQNDQIGRHLQEGRLANSELLDSLATVQAKGLPNKRSQRVPGCAKGPGLSRESNTISSRFTAIKENKSSSRHASSRQRTHRRGYESGSCQHLGLARAQSRHTIAVDSSQAAPPRQSLLAGPLAPPKKKQSKTPFLMDQGRSRAAQQAQRELFDKVHSQAQRKQQEMKKNLAKLYFSGSSQRKSLGTNYQPLQRQTQQREQAAGPKTSHNTSGSCVGSKANTQFKTFQTRPKNLNSGNSKSAHKSVSKEKNSRPTTGIADYKKQPCSRRYPPSLGISDQIKLLRQNESLTLPLDLISNKQGGHRDQNHHAKVSAHRIGQAQQLSPADAQSSAAPLACATKQDLSRRQPYLGTGRSGVVVGQLISHETKRSNCTTTPSHLQIDSRSNHHQGPDETAGDQRVKSATASSHHPDQAHGDALAGHRDMQRLKESALSPASAVSGGSCLSMATLKTKAAQVAALRRPIQLTMGAEQMDQVEREESPTNPDQIEALAPSPMEMPNEGESSLPHQAQVHQVGRNLAAEKDEVDQQDHHSGVECYQESGGDGMSQQRLASSQMQTSPEGDQGDDDGGYDQKGMQNGDHEIREEDGAELGGSEIVTLPQTIHSEQDLEYDQTHQRQDLSFHDPQEAAACAAMAKAPSPSYPQPENSQQIPRPVQQHPPGTAAQNPTRSRSPSASRPQRTAQQKSGKAAAPTPTKHRLDTGRTPYSLESDAARQERSRLEEERLEMWKKAKRLGNSYLRQNRDSRSVQRQAQCKSAMRKAMGGKSGEGAANSQAPQEKEEQMPQIVNLNITEESARPEIEDREKQYEADAEIEQTQASKAEIQMASEAKNMRTDKESARTDEQLSPRADSQPQWKPNAQADQQEPKKRKGSIRQYTRSSLHHRKSSSSARAGRDSKLTSQKQKFQKFQQSLRYLNLNLGPVLKGYKCRRIYYNNPEIRQLRIEYRDQIQFAFMLQNEMNEISEKVENELIGGEDLAKLCSEIDLVKDTLSDTLNEMRDKRMHFVRAFRALNRPQDLWLAASQPGEIQDILYEQASKFEANMMTYKARKAAKLSAIQPFDEYVRSESPSQIQNHQSEDNHGLVQQSKDHQMKIESKHHQERSPIQQRFRGSDLNSPSKSDLDSRNQTDLGRSRPLDSQAHQVESLNECVGAQIPRLEAAQPEKQSEMPSLADNGLLHKAQAEVDKGNVATTDDANIIASENANCNAFMSPNVRGRGGQLDDGSAVKNMSYASPMLDQEQSHQAAVEIFQEQFAPGAPSDSLTSGSHNRSFATAGIQAKAASKIPKCAVPGAERCSASLSSRNDVGENQAPQFKTIDAPPGKSKVRRDRSQRSMPRLPASPKRGESNPGRQNASVEQNLNGSFDHNFAATFNVDQMINQKEVAKDASRRDASGNCERKTRNAHLGLGDQRRAHKTKARSVYAGGCSPTHGHSENFKPITERTQETGGDSFRLVPTAVEQPAGQHRQIHDRDIYGSYDQNVHGQSQSSWRGKGDNASTVPGRSRLSLSKRSDQCSQRSNTGTRCSAQKVPQNSSAVKTRKQAASKSRSAQKSVGSPMKKQIKTKRQSVTKTPKKVPSAVKKSPMKKSAAKRDKENTGLLDSIEEIRTQPLQGDRTPVQDRKHKSISLAQSASMKAIKRRSRGERVTNSKKNAINHDEVKSTNHAELSPNNPSPYNSVSRQDAAHPPFRQIVTSNFLDDGPTPGEHATPTLTQDFSATHGSLRATNDNMPLKVLSPQDTNCQSSNCQEPRPWTQEAGSGSPESPSRTLNQLQMMLQNLNNNKAGASKQPLQMKREEVLKLIGNLQSHFDVMLQSDDVQQ